MTGKTPEYHSSHEPQLQPVSYLSSAIQILDVHLKNHPDHQKAVHSLAKCLKKLMRLTSYETINQEITDIPEVLKAADVYTDLRLGANLGFYVQVQEAIHELQAVAAKAFPPSVAAQLTRFRMSFVPLKDTTPLTQLQQHQPSLNMKEILEYTIGLIQLEWYQGYNIKLPEKQRTRNTIQDLYPRANTFGQALRESALALTKRKEKKLSQEEYAAWMSTFNSILQTELRDPQKKVIRHYENTSNQYLADLLFDLVVSSPHGIAEKLPQQKKSIDPRTGKNTLVPVEITRLFNKGLPLLEVLRKILAEIPVAVADAQHLGHFSTIEMIETLNQFSVLVFDPASGESLSSVDRSALNNYPFSLGLMKSWAEYEILGKNVNIQEIAHAVSMLASKSSDNEQRKKYETFLYQIFERVKSDLNYVVFDPRDLEREIFDTSQPTTPTHQVPVEAWRSINTIHQVVPETHFKIHTDTAKLRQMNAPELPLHADFCDASLQAEQLAENVYVFYLTLFTYKHPKKLSQELMENMGAKKLTYIVKLEGGNLKVEFPIVNQKGISSHIEAQAIEVLLHILKYSEQETVQKLQAHQPAIQKSETPPQLTARQKKKQQYIPRSKAQEKEQTTAKEDGQRTSSEGSVAFKEVIASYGPNQLIISTALRKVFNSNLAKGRKSVIYQVTKNFLKAYSAAQQSEKPGSGVPLRDVHSFDKRRIWRFKFGKIRIFAVEGEKGEAVVSWVERRTEVTYSTKNIKERILPAVDRAVEEYLAGQ